MWVIKIQSVIDIITNSSTEVFVEATDDTVKYTKDIIETLMQICGENSQTCDDLFDISLIGYERLAVVPKVDNKLVKEVAGLFNDFIHTISGVQIVKIQSFIDVITNSSTEMFTQPTKKTVETMKEIVDLLLISQGSTKRADDLFYFKLRSQEYQERVRDEGYEEIFHSYGSEDDYVANNGNGETCPIIYLEILPRDADNKYVEMISKLFNELQSKYETEEYMC